MLKSFSIALAVALGGAAIANGMYMLVAPESWYVAVPGVTTTGPFNQHFVRDIGLVFLFIGGAFLLGAVRAAARVVSWPAASVWLSGHALFHFWEVTVGICVPSALARDFPAVALPAVIGLAITVWAMIDARNATFATGARAT